MNKLINDANAAVSEMVDGLVMIGPHLRRVGHHNAVALADLSATRECGRVAVISGGGAGHEPAHAGFVGEGLLTAAVSGEVFTSPPVDVILDAILCCTGASGALLVVKNYTGDRLNFGLAAELARARGLHVRMLLVADDCAWAVPPADGARGLAGTLFVHKVAGAAAAAGLPLQDVYREAAAAAHEVATYGVALSGCTAPGYEQPSFNLNGDGIAMGVGIHGERGVEIREWPGANALVQAIIDRLAAKLTLAPDSRVALLVNGLGSTSTMELAIVAGAAHRELQRRRICVERIWTGPYVTAANMAGCSISVMRVDEARLQRLDAPARAQGWVPGTAPHTSRSAWAVEHTARNETLLQRDTADPGLSAALERVATALTGAEPLLAELDRRGGDGDLGRTMARLGSQLRSNIDSLARRTPAGLLLSLSQLVRQTLGGTSGPLYAAGLLRAASALGNSINPCLAEWVDSFEAAIRGVSELGGASPGERTMIDALVPAAASLRASLEERVSCVEALSRMARAAEAGAFATAAMVPRRGRASQIADSSTGSRDGGAVAAAIWLQALARTGQPEHRAPV